MSLTHEESEKLVELMQKVTFPVPPNVFDAWCEFFTINTVELAVFRINDKQEKEVFLTFRKDKYFDGWHIPGSVILPGNKVKDVIKRVITKELHDMQISEPKFLTWFEREKGIGKDLCARGQEISLLYQAELLSEPKETDTEKFFSFSNIPHLLEQHNVLVDFLRNNVL